ncbi:MAG: hypothetical protein JXA90_15585, partial [Planctomycetes bacterium]|nr:hypothetical protein [Planctomycetota bacterium]
DRWDDAYFARLRDFVRHAGRREVVVEYVLFCPFYADDQWKLSPMNAANNVQGVGVVARTDPYTLDKNGGLLNHQEAMVRKVVRELNEFDNVYWEICNEPYFGGVSMEWQHHIADVIVAAERDLPRKHLISQNVANNKAKVENPHPAISIFNFHYASPPVTVAMNYGLNKVIGDNETGFKGTGDAHYRMEGWEFILAGGGLYNNLDYSFTAGCEDGRFEYPKTQPGGGSAALRRQLRILQEFISSFDFIRMRPAADLVGTRLPEGARVHLLAEPGRQYAAYVHGGQKIDLEIEAPPGRYRAEWISPLTGEVVKTETMDHAGGRLRAVSPDNEGEIALRCLRRARG